MHIIRTNKYLKINAGLIVCFYYVLLIIFLKYNNLVIFIIF